MSFSSYPLLFSLFFSLLIPSFFFSLPSFSVFFLLIFSLFQSCFRGSLNSFHVFSFIIFLIPYSLTYFTSLPSVLLALISVSSLLYFFSFLFLSIILYCSPSLYFSPSLLPFFFRLSSFVLFLIRFSSHSSSLLSFVPPFPLGLLPFLSPFL